MTVELNGRRAELAEDARVSDAVAETGRDPDGRGIAVAIDGEVVPRSHWAKLALREGQRIEVVGAVQGG